MTCEMKRPDVPVQTDHGCLIRSAYLSCRHGSKAEFGIGLLVAKHYDCGGPPIEGAVLADILNSIVSRLLLIAEIPYISISAIVHIVILGSVWQFGGANSAGLNFFANIEPCLRNCSAGHCVDSEDYGGTSENSWKEAGIWMFDCETNTTNRPPQGACGSWL